MFSRTHNHTDTANLVPQWLVANMQSATVTTFSKMIGNTVCISPEEVGEDTHYDGVIGIISFIGDVTWSMAVGFPHTSAEAVAYKFAGFEIPFDSADMTDVVGELVNVLAGVICGELENTNMKMQMSLPTVARGKDFQMALPENLVAQLLHFSAGDHHFAIKLIVAKYQ